MEYVGELVEITVTISGVKRVVKVVIERRRNGVLRVHNSTVDGEWQRYHARSGANRVCGIGSERGRDCDRTGVCRPFENHQRGVRTRRIILDKGNLRAVGRKRDRGQRRTSGVESPVRRCLRWRRTSAAADVQIIKSNYASLRRGTGQTRVIHDQIRTTRGPRIERKLCGVVTCSHRGACAYVYTPIAAKQVSGTMPPTPTIALILRLGNAPSDLLDVAWVSRQSKLVHQVVRRRE